MTRVDMSPRAIAARLAEVSALNRLCESLGRAGATHEASVGYERELDEVLGLTAVAAACAAAPTAVQLVLRPAFDPEVCVSLIDHERGTTLEVRSIDRSVWEYWNSRRDGRSVDPIRGWVRPHLAVESIDGVVPRAEAFTSLSPRAGGPTIDGMWFTLTSWRAGQHAVLSGDASEPVAAGPMWALLESVFELVRWEQSRRALSAVMRHRC